MPAERVIGTRTTSVTIYSNSTPFEVTDVVEDIAYKRFEDNDVDAILIIKEDTTGTITKKYSTISIWGDKGSATYKPFVD